jgi:hypothetical protein
MKATVERFLQRDLNVVHSAESAPLRRFLAMLREIGVTAAKAPEPRNCQQRFIDEYRRYLLQERGLAETSLLNYVPFAERHLVARERMALGRSVTCQKDFLSARLGQTRSRNQPRTVSGLATQATCPRALRPSLFPISASVDRSGSDKRNRAGKCALRIRFSAAKYSFCSSSS